MCPKIPRSKASNVVKPYTAESLLKDNFTMQAYSDTKPVYNQQNPSIALIERPMKATAIKKRYEAYVQIYTNLQEPRDTSMHQFECYVTSQLRLDPVKRIYVHM